jgi:hypothetical protein
VSADVAGDRIRGIDEPLPAGERLLWQGAPDWRALAVRRFHVRAVLVYFVLLMLWRVLTVPTGASAAAWILSGLAVLAALASLAGGAICLFSWLVQRTTVYAVTNRRVVMRTGVALPSVLNLPLRVVEAAAVAPQPDGTGTVALQLQRDEHVAWLLIWPHARPWRLRHPEPALVCVPDVARVAEHLRSALAAAVAAEEEAPGVPAADTGSTHDLRRAERSLEVVS